MTTDAVIRAKQVVRDLWARVLGTDGSLAGIGAGRFDQDVEFHGPAPIDSTCGFEAMTEAWLERLGRAFPTVQKVPYVFLGGEWNGQAWVASTGEWRGEFSGDLCGIPATNGQARLRFGEFMRVEDDKVVEVRMLLDLPALAADAGIRLLPPFAGRDELPPPPIAGNGVTPDGAEAPETAATLQLVEDMLGGCNRLVDGELRSMGMDAYWHDDMRWYGPWGIGSTHGFDEFQRFAQGPSVASFPNRRGGFHQARIAEGVTAAFTGWPSLQGDFDGVPFRGIAPTGGPIGQNIMDFYVRRGDRLHENWVLIDLIDFARQCGVDLLAELPGAR